MEGLAELVLLLLQQALELQRAAGGAAPVEPADGGAPTSAAAGADWPVQLAASLCQQVGRGRARHALRVVRDFLGAMCIEPSTQHYIGAWSRESHLQPQPECLARRLRSKVHNGASVCTSVTRLQVRPGSLGWVQLAGHARAGQG